jgi:hypothetical protein
MQKQQFSAAASFAQTGLERGEKCLCIGKRHLEIFIDT